MVQATAKTTGVCTVESTGNPFGSSACLNALWLPLPSLPLPTTLLRACGLVSYVPSVRMDGIPAYDGGKDQSMALRGDIRGRKPWAEQSGEHAGWNPPTADVAGGVGERGRVEATKPLTPRGRSAGGDRPVLGAVVCQIGKESDMELGRVRKGKPRGHKLSSRKWGAPRRPPCAPSADAPHRCHWQCGGWRRRHVGGAQRNSRLIQPGRTRNAPTPGDTCAAAGAPSTSRGTPTMADGETCACPSRALRGRFLRDDRTLRSAAVMGVAPAAADREASEGGGAAALVRFQNMCQSLIQV